MCVGGTDDVLYMYERWGYYCYIESLTQLGRDDSPFLLPQSRHDKVTCNIITA